MFLLLLPYLKMLVLFCPCTGYECAYIVEVELSRNVLYD